MSQTIAFTSTELAILASYIASGTGSLALNPQAQNITEASRNINLKFNTSAITHDQPPQLTPPQQIRQIIIGSTTLTNSTVWTPAWASAVVALRAQGRSIQSGVQPVDKAQHVSTSQGQLLTTVLGSAGAATVTATVVTTTATQGEVGPQGPQGIQGIQGVVGPQGPAGQNALDVSSFEIDISGNLIVMFGDSSTVNLGSVKGPQGIQGIQGIPGTSPLNVSSFEIDISGNLIVMFGDSSTVNLGSVIGPQGPTGPSGPGSGDVISQGGSYVDNSVVRYDGPSGTLIQVSSASISDAGLLTATSFSGDGSLITALNATQLTSGTVPVARLGASGTASASTYLRGDNTWATAGGSAAGGFVSVQYFTTAGAITWTKPVGINKIYVYVIGGGGGGLAYNGTGAPGGGGGGCAIKMIDVTSIATISGVVGTGGVAGGSGSSSTFSNPAGTITAGGGSVGSNGGGYPVGGSGGTATGGDLNIPGGQASPLSIANSMGGTGGIPAFFGVAGIGAGYVAAGTAGIYGGGGGGAGYVAAATAGGDGIIVVYEYS